MIETLTIPVFRLAPDTAPDMRLNALEEELAACAQALDDGDVRRMDGIDSEVKILCDQVLQMSTGDAGPYIQRLQALSDAFGALGEVMEAQKEMIRDELSDAQARQKAHRAYGMREIASSAADDAKDE